MISFYTRALLHVSSSSAMLDKHGAARVIRHVTSPSRLTRTTCRACRDVS